MGGGLLQLVARGAQDAHLSGPDGQSFWRQRYQRHKNFALESIQQRGQGQQGFGRRAAYTMSRNGDLLMGVVLEFTLKRGSTGDTFYPAEHLIKEVELQIGGLRVDLVTNTWLRLYDELYRKIDDREAYRQMTDFEADDPAGTVKRFYLPVPFWFCAGEASAALPMVALSNHEVQVFVTTERAGNLPGVDPGHPCDVALWGDFVFLDDEERRWFAGAAEHRYLIEQTQVLRQPVVVDAQRRTQAVGLSFNHPVKYLAWVLKPSVDSHALFTGADTGLQSKESCGPLASCGLQLNGLDRLAPRPGAYFRLHHPWTTFRQAPSVGVYAYSFALRPTSPEPSGSLNLSRLDDARLVLTTKTATLADDTVPYDEDQTLVSAAALSTVEVYARSYNVLIIRDGQAALAYAS